MYPYRQGLNQNLQVSESEGARCLNVEVDELNNVIFESPPAETCQVRVE